MKYSPQELDAVQAAAALERPLRAVEEQLVALGTALHRQDAAAVDAAAEQLHVALAAAVEHFTRAARADAGAGRADGAEGSVSVEHNGSTVRVTTLF